MFKAFFEFEIYPVATWYPIGIRTLDRFLA